MSWHENYGGSIMKPKGVLEGMQLRLGDIGIVTTIFQSSKLLSQDISGFTSFVAFDVRAVAKTVDEIAREYFAMQNEFAAQNQVDLAICRRMVDLAGLPNQLQDLLVGNSASF